MSVLSSKRTQSRAEYVNKANKIYIETIRFLTRLSARYARILAQPIADLAGDVLDNCERANTYYPKDDERRALRREALLKARGSLRALNV